jgi:cytochrome c-type biogenesis protein
MIELLGALIAGVLTTLAPCVLPLLPIIVGGSMAGALAEERAGSGASALAGGTTTQQATKERSAVTRAMVITISLGMSILVFTLALKATTALIGIPPQTWQWVSGAVLIALGVVGAFPDLWERLSARLGLQARSATKLGAARRRDGMSGEILTGAALGPVFTSCSPLYGYVIVTVLPAEPVRGLVLLSVYIVGLCATLLLIALAGQRVVARFGWAADSHGWFRRGLGIVFIAVGVLVATGWMKAIETWLAVNAPFAPWNLDSQFIG